MSLVENGIPEGYDASSLLILDIPGRGLCYVNPDGIPIDQLGRKNISPEELESVIQEKNEVENKLADAAAEIENLRAQIEDSKKSGSGASQVQTSTSNATTNAQPKTDKP